MRADFTVFQHNLLRSLAGDASLLPEVTATFVDGECAFGCGNLLSAPKAATAAASDQNIMAQEKTHDSSVGIA